MSRTVEVSLPSEHTANLLPKIQKLEGLIGLRVQKNISIKPRGDVLSFDLINSEVTNFLTILEEEGLLQHEDVSITTNRPTNVISKSHSHQILTESHESSWEDMLKNLLHESNMNLNTRILMFFSGLIAAIGISTNSLHIVVGAMLIAPGFEPISRFAMGLVSQHRDWRRGGTDTLIGYAVLILGAVAGAFMIRFLGKDLLPGSSTYLSAGALVEYWSTITATSVIVSIFASLAGGIIIMSNKSLLTAGVMVALALIPSASLTGMALVEGKYQLAANAALRLFMEIGIVAIFTGVIFLWKRLTTHKRSMQV